MIVTVIDDLYKDCERGLNIEVNKIKELILQSKKFIEENTNFDKEIEVNIKIWLPYIEDQALKVNLWLDKGVFYSEIGNHEDHMIGYLELEE